MKAFLLALLSTCALSLAADDQVDNLGNLLSFQIVLNESGVPGTFEGAAQAFTTNSVFSALDTVTVLLRHNFPPQPPFGTSTARVELWTGDEDAPELKLETVGTTDIFNSQDFFALDSTSNTTLAPNTRYWIVVVRETGDIFWRNSADGGITGASIGSLPELRATSSDGENWDPFPTGNFQIMKVETNPIPAITVTSPADDNSAGTLRNAIESASSQSTTSIVFAPELNGATITLSGSELSTSKDLVIDASSLPLGITISGGEASRIFEFSGDAEIFLKAITIANGKNLDFGSGGGISQSGGTLRMEQCSVIDNEASDAPQGSELVGGDGGGILVSDGNLLMKKCTIARNRAGDGDGGQGGIGDGNAGGFGGGIYGNTSTIILKQCTIVDNKAGDGLGEGSGGVGGGIFFDTFSDETPFVVDQCTIVGNRAGDGFSGSIGGDGGGIVANARGIVAKALIRNSIIAANTVGSGNLNGGGPDLEISSRLNLEVEGVNLIGDNTDQEADFPAGDFVGTSGNPLDPLLGDLANNGGLTETMLPLRGSPVLNPIGGATASDFPTDQRGPGFPRINAGVMEIGAVEAPDYAAIDAAVVARAAQRASLTRKLKRLQKKFKNARRKKQVVKVKKFRKQIKRLKKQIRSL